MKIIGDEHQICSMSAAHGARYTLALGEKARVRTKDCYCNLITQEDCDPSKIEFPGPNPATGPIEITGVAAGDTLKVVLHSVIPDDVCTMYVRPGMGAMEHLSDGPLIRKLHIENGRLRFGDNLSFELNPMVGVLGVAPAQGEEISNAVPHKHGGNMDTRLVAAGSAVYLPVNVDGAMLALGDIHAVMGDGEVAICGAEAAGEVELTCERIAGRQQEWPVIETGDAFYVVCSDETLDGAARLANDAAYNFIAARAKLTPNEIIMLMSLVCHLEISQIVDPLVTCRVRMPKTFTDQLGIAF